MTLQAQRQTQAGQALLKTADQLIQPLGVGQARGQAAAALIQQFEGGVGLLQVQGFLPDLGFEGAVGLLDGLGHGVEAGGQLAQLILGLMVDPRLVLAAAKALGGVDQFLQRADHAALQFVEANQQDDHGDEQCHALNDLLPGLLVFALALQQVDELVELLDEGQGAGLERYGVATLKGRAEGVLPVVLQLLVAAIERLVATVFQHALECLAVEPLLQAFTDAVDCFAIGTGGQVPAQAVGLHAHRACGVDRCRIALAEPGDQAGAQRAGQRQHRDQDHRHARTRGQRAT
ncbi:hypothetical protein D3C78_822800 [compost metagenome]